MSERLLLANDLNFAPQPNVERLLKLADFLETVVPPERFDMNFWWFKKKYECGMAGCALGWAAQIPEFRELGLTTSGSNENHQYPVFRITEWRSRNTFGAAEAFFGLSFKDSRRLFSRGSYPAEDEPTPLDVAKAIREFVGGLSVVCRPPLDE